MSRPPAPARVGLAKRVARVVEERGAVHENDLVTIIGCDRIDLRAAIGIAYHWHRVDRCGSWLVPASSREKRRSA